MADFVGFVLAFVVLSSVVVLSAFIILERRSSAKRRNRLDGKRRSAMPPTKHLS